LQRKAKEYASVKDIRKKLAKKVLKVAKTATYDGKSLLEISSQINLCVGSVKLFT